MRHGARLGLLLGLALAGCQEAPPPAAGAGRYMLGEPYSLGGIWSYPKEEFALEETGVASVIPDTRPGRRTASGEVFDPASLVAAHRTLQLPAILSVWNLETGREVRVRVNDRGPDRPGRVVGLSRRAAELLGIPPGGAAQVRIRVEEGPSRALARGMGGGTAVLPITAAPRAAVETETLAPLPGTREAIRVRSAGIRPVSTGLPVSEAPMPPLRLPEEVTTRPAVPGRLVVEAGTFFRGDLAQRQAARIGGRVVPFGTGRQTQYRVRLGPFADLAEADRALAGVLGGGQPEARLLVD